jgi:4-hydroxybenzoate polyprenyltransferase
MTDPLKPPANASPSLPLVVDLDGTLCRTDTLWECFFAAWRVQWWLPLASVFWMLSGRSKLKDRLAAIALPEVAELPWNLTVVDALRAARANGHRTVLATAANARIAQACADELDLFDEVMASDGAVNLKGQAKARQLIERFGSGGFDYVGDSTADLPVWAAASRKLTVSRVMPAGGERLEEGVGNGALSRWVKLLRVRHWVKNVLVFVAPVAAHQWAAGATWVPVLLTFAAFCAVCSGVYVLNDLFDLASDRTHPTKRHRPLATGELSLATATLVSFVLLIGGLALAFSIGTVVGAVIAFYVVANAVYTVRLKRVAVFDVFCLAGLYTLRIVAGAAAVAVPLSTWLVAFSVFAFLSLALLKRAADIDRLAPDEALPGRGYSGKDAAFVNGFGISTAIAACLVLTLYIASEQVAAMYGEPLWLWGVAVVVLVWLARMWRMAMNGTMDDDPVMFAMRDGVSIGCGLAVAVFTSLAL